MSEQQTLLPGGWTAYHPLTAQDRKVFEKALNGHLGVDYEPQKVKTQVVAGTNYRFLCEASVPPSTAVWEAIVEIYAPLPGQGAPHITQIIRI
ncbi:MULTISPECIES: hypothetical protein [unclassified Cedecea]|uniref:hypothetical protein n=1 Tax=unclassified Cedecea TaxID=2649846 RepID=UPI0030162272